MITSTEESDRICASLARIPDLKAREWYKRGQQTALRAVAKLMYEKFEEYWQLPGGFVNATAFSRLSIDISLDAEQIAREQGEL